MSTQCPHCNSENSDRRKNCHACGKSVRDGSAGDDARTDAPPHITETLGKILRSYQMRKHHLPACMPQDVDQAAQFWIGMQEAPNEQFESPRRTGTKDGGSTWDCPYHARLGLTLRVFLKLKHEDQKIIIACREDGVFWRGDDIDFLLKVAHETARMHEIGIESYRREAMDKSRKFLGRMNNAA